MNNRHMISISGIDGSGKTTQLIALINYYRTQGFHDISYMALPKTEPITDIKAYYETLKLYDLVLIRSCCRRTKGAVLLKKISNSNVIDNEEMRKLSHYFIEDTRIWFEEVIYKLLNDNKIILFDRFYWDELPYHYLFHANLEEMIAFGKTLPRPMSFFLKIPLKVVIERNQDRPDKNKKVFSSEEKIKRILEGYEKYVEPHCDVILDATQNEKVITNQILQLIEHITVQY